MEILGELSRGAHFEETIKTSVFGALPCRGLRNHLVDGDYVVCKIQDRLIIGGKSMAAASRAILHAEVQQTEEAERLVLSLEKYLRKVRALMLPIRLAFSKNPPLLPEPRDQDLNKRQSKLLGKRQITKSIYYAPKHNMVPANFDFEVST